MNIDLYLDDTKIDQQGNPLIILNIEGRQAIFAKQLANIFNGGSTAKEELRKLRETGGYKEGEGYKNLSYQELVEISRWEKTTSGKSAVESLLTPFNTMGAAIIFEEGALWLLARSTTEKGREFSKILVSTFIAVRDGHYIEADSEDVKRLREKNQYSEAENRLKDTVFKRGLINLGTFIWNGDNAYYDVENSKTIRLKKEIPEGRAFADFDSTIEIRAKTLAKDLTDESIKTKDLKTMDEMTDEYVGKNKQMRKMLTDSGIYPENTLKLEDIKDVKKRTQKQLKSDNGLKKLT
jgi:hypothetical protein